MAKSDITQTDEIERILNLPYGSQLRWAAKAEPWSDLTLPETEIARGAVNEQNGNVTRMPNLGGRPCFGNPIAWARHGVVEYKKGRNGAYPTRCGRCKARPGCERVAEARLSATPEITAAHAAFRTAGGPRELNSRQSAAASRALLELVRRLETHGPFTSVNDDYAQAWPEKRRKEIRAEATARKQKQRRLEAAAAFRKREIPSLLAEHMDRERHARAIRYRDFRASGEAPSRITIDPTNNNDRFTSDVWLARERLIIMKKSTSPYAIAKEMRTLGRAYDLEHEVLRQRIAPALKRIEVLETTTFPGGTDQVWPAFNAKKVLNDLLLPTPYETADEEVTFTPSEDRTDSDI